MRRFSSFLAVSLLFGSLLAAATLPELFQKAKEQFRLHSYASALETLNQMRADSEKPENESLRTSMRPALAFYRGACLAALDRKEEARAEFEVFLAYQPNATLDPAIYPKKVVALLDETRKTLGQKKQTPEETGSVATAYRAFIPSPAAGQKNAEAGEDWADGPVRVLLTSEQRRAYSRLADPISRSEFIAAFWKSRDPRPDTADNEFRAEFEKRVAFSDANFTEAEVRGSLTDRGAVFLLMGPPTYVGRKPIATGEDTADPAGMSRYSRHDVNNAISGTSGAAANAIVDRMTGPSNQLPSSSSNWREVWHYRRELLPRGLPYQQVDFEFITRQGYGRNVLERTADALNTLETARKSSASREQSASR